MSERPGAITARVGTPIAVGAGSRAGTVTALLAAPTTLPHRCHAPGTRQEGVLRDDQRREVCWVISCPNAAEKPQHRVRRPRAAGGQAPGPSSGVSRGEILPTESAAGTCLP